MAIKFSAFTKAVPFVLNICKPVLIRGRHGVGKSELVYQIAHGLDMPVVERRASQMTEGDLLGLPVIEGETTTWMAPDWFQEACNVPVVLFLDEIDRATLEVRQGIFELTDSRKLNGYHLHDGTLIFGAVNGGIHGAQYSVGEFDPAELDRWTVFDVEPDVKDWLDWAKTEVSDVVWDFIAHNHDHLEHIGEFEPNKVYPSRRSWVRFDECLQQGDLLEKATGVVVNLGLAFVGKEAAIAFNDFLQNYTKIVTVEDILDKGKFKLVKDFTINDHSAMCEKFEKAEIFKEEMTPKRMKNFAKYFVSLPSEVAMKLWGIMGMTGNDLENTVNLHAVKVADYGTVGEYFVNVLTTTTEE